MMGPTQPSRRGVWGLGSVYLFVVALLILGRLISPGFWAGEHLLQVLKDVSILGIVAVGLTFITLSGHYVDLSIPVIMACAGVVAVCLLPYGFVLALLASLATGGLLGLINGFMVGYLRLNPILWTLAAMSVADGLTRWAYGGRWVYVGKETAPGALFAGLYGWQWFGFLPLAVVLFVVVALAGDFLMRHTGYGKQLKLTGASYETARLSGVNVRRIVLGAFVLSGLTAALGGLIKTSFTLCGDVEIGLTYEFQAITAVVVGGVTLAGGRGTVLGVVGGVLLMGLLGRILPLLPHVGQDEQFMVRGLIFVAAVGLNMWALRRAGRSDV
jgi:ribose/xylose/arabinose/galactoside ABC-type transport system permease subunit